LSFQSWTFLKIPYTQRVGRNLLAFVTHPGNNPFHYTITPFGLSSDPRYFQKIISIILGGVPGLAVYLDNIAIHYERL
jgi:hypothetical protein